MIMNHYEEEQEYKNKSDDDIYIYTPFLVGWTKNQMIL
jgi:hypothetical protein